MKEYLKYVFLGFLLAILLLTSYRCAIYEPPLEQIMFGEGLVIEPELNGETESCGGHYRDTPCRWEI